MIKISGQQILDELGGPINISGIGTGTWEMGRIDDVNLMVSVGAMSGRIVHRWNGDYSGFRTDSLDDSDSGRWHTSVDYVNRLKQYVQLHRDAGLRVNLALDSNNGQGKRGLDGWDFWSLDVPEARQRRRQFIKMAAYLAREIKPDFMEPIVEPRSIRSAPVDVWKFQEQVMDAVLASSPDMLFIIGGYRSYHPEDVDNFYNPAWAEKYPDKIVLTANFLSARVCNPAENLPHLDRMAEVASKFKLPAHIQQFGSTSQDDPDCGYLDQFCKEMRLRNISGTLWEAVSIWPSFGLSYLERPHDINSRHIEVAERIEVIRWWLK